MEIDTEERGRGPGFFRVVGDRWTEEYEERLKDLNLNDNAARFKKEEQVASLVLVRKRSAERGGVKLQSTGQDKKCGSRRKGR